jgi:imidazoleglycerol-phosphate dehydratase/histidinol-phosphatase
VVLLREQHRFLWDTWQQYVIEEGVLMLGTVDVPESGGLLAIAPAIAALLSDGDRQSVSLLSADTDAPLLARTLNVGLLSITESFAWIQLLHEILFPARRVEISRKTSETEIAVSLDLDSQQPVKIQTGLAFFDHMLEQIARHSGMSLILTATGDLHIDEHHTIEDTALAFGEAIKRAVGDKRGMDRYGFYLPMDEAEARVALDMSNRPVLVWDVKLSRERVGDFPCEMAEHFFQSLAVAAGITLRIAAAGTNDHHIIESIFKAVGKSFKQAFHRSASDEIPSTKGVL